MSFDKLVSEQVFKHKPYQPGKQPKFSTKTIKLNTNENPYPPSPLVKENLFNQVNQLHLYPESSSKDLRVCIANLHKVDPDQVIIGNGSDDILNLCVRSFSDSSKKVGFFDPSYSLYEVLCSVQGCPTNKISFQNSSFDIDINLITKSGCNLFFVTSPHAPSGRSYENILFSDILKKYKGVFVIDEAYADFAPQNAVNLLKEFDNLIITRTLSKSYSLAGLRVGYGISSKKIISILNRVREVYNTDRLAQHIAKIALTDQEYFSQNTKSIINSRENFYEELQKWGWHTYKSGANFLFTRPIGKDGQFGKSTAQDLHSFLQNEEVFIRYFPYHPLTEAYVRISVGKEKEMDMLLKKLIKWQSKDPQK